MAALLQTSSPSKPTRIVIADDHDLIRAGVRSLLAGQHGLEVIGDATSGQHAIELCQQLQPDLILLDVDLPDMDGLDLVRKIKQACASTHIMIMTTAEDPDYLIEALRLGVVGYMLKGVTHAELLSAIQRVLRQEVFVNNPLMSRALKQLVSPRSRAAETPIERLTNRELEVLRLISQGHTNRTIAAALTISPGTVKVHIERIIAKMGVADRTQAAVRAVELRLI